MDNKGECVYLLSLGSHFDVKLPSLPCIFTVKSCPIHFIVESYSNTYLNNISIIAKSLLVCPIKLAKWFDVHLPNFQCTFVVESCAMYFYSKIFYLESI